MKLKLPSLGIIFMTLSGSLYAQTVLRHEEGGGVVVRAIIFPRGQLDRSAATKVARQFLDRYSDGNVILNLVMGVDELEVQASLYHHIPAIESNGLDRMKSLMRLVQDISRVGPPKGPIARLVSVNGNALLSYRDGVGIFEEVLHGTDPTRFRMNDVDFQLVHLAFDKGSDALTPEVRYGLTLYFRAATKISLSGVIGAMQRMTSGIKIKNVVARIRRDAWFLEYDDYPLFPAFIKELAPPNAMEYELSSYASCSSHPRYGLKCSGRNFEP